MDWKDAYTTISTGKITSKQRSALKELFWDAYRSGVLDDLMKDEYARMVYEKVFNRKYKSKFDKIEYNVNAEKQKNNNDDMLELLKLSYHGLQENEMKLDDNGNVSFKIVTDTKSGKQKIREVSVPIERFKKIINRERPAISGFNCALCGEKVTGRADFSPSGLLYHQDCLDFIKIVLTRK